MKLILHASINTQEFSSANYLVRHIAKKWNIVYNVYEFMQETEYTKFSCDQLNNNNIHSMHIGMTKLKPILK